MESLTPTQILIATFAVVIGFGAVCSVVAFRRLQRQSYRCRRCDREFRRAAHERFPTSCPHCGATDWQLPG